MEKENTVRKLKELFESRQNDSGRDNLVKRSYKNNNRGEKNNKMPTSESFLEVKNSEELSELRKRLSNMMNIQIARMKEDSFINETESVNIDLVEDENIKHLEETSLEENRDILSRLSKSGENEENESQIDGMIKSNFERRNFGLLRVRGAFKLLVPMKSNAMVFLFENIIIIATEIEANSENYQYYHSTHIKDLYIEALEDNKIMIKDLSAAQTFNDSKVQFVLKTNEKMWIEWKYTLANVVYDRLDTKNIQFTSKNTEELDIAVAGEPFESSLPLSNTQSIQKTTSIISPKDSSPPISARTSSKSINNFDITNGKSEFSPAAEKKLENLLDLPPLPARNTKCAPPLPPRNKILTNDTTSERLTEHSLESSKLENNSNVFKSIKNIPNKYDKYYGSFIMKDIFIVKGPISMISTVFLFENVIVITQLNDNLMEPQIYDFFTSIHINDLSINSINEYTFTLTNFTKAKADDDPVKNTYYLKAKTTEIATMWWESLESKLWNQLIQMKAEVKVPPLIPIFAQSESTTKMASSGRTNKNEEEGLLLKSIKYSTINKKEYGAFKMKEIFQVIQPINFISMVFLFESVVVITVFDKSDSGYFYFYGGIKIKKLRLESTKDLIISLIESPSKSKKKQQTTTEKYTLKAQTFEVWELWIKTIENMLLELK